MTQLRHCRPELVNCCNAYAVPERRFWGHKDNGGFWPAMVRSQTTLTLDGTRVHLAGRDQANVTMSHQSDIIKELCDLELRDLEL